MPTTALPQLERRAVEIRADAATSADTREFSGIGVPYNDPVTIRTWLGTYTEQIAPGAVEHDDDVKVFWRHGEIIGRVIRDEDTEAGWKPTGALSDTTLGRDAYALLKDGSIDRMSIGFEPIEHTEHEDEDGNVTITRTRIRVREVSLVPFPAYDGAAVEHVRTATEKENPAMPTATDAAVLDREQVRSIVTESTDDLSRRLDVLSEQLQDNGDDPGAMPQTTFRSAAALFKAMANGDADAVREYKAVVEYFDAQARDWSPAGETTGDHADTGSWIGDLTRIADGPSGIMSRFASAPLPDKGMFLEYAKWVPDTAEVAQQTAEGTTLTLLGGTSTLDTAPVNTYGGYSRLSRQTVQRASINVLNHTLTRQGVSARRALRTGFNLAYEATVVAQVGNAVALPTEDVPGWISALVDAAVYYDDQAVNLDALVVDPETFKSLSAVESTSGDLLMNVYGDGVNRTGRFNVSTLEGNVLNVPVVPNLAATSQSAAFVNFDAIRTHRSPLATLSDENVTDLYNDYSIYVYATFLAEFPEYVVPVTFPV